MSHGSIPAALRRLVVERAGGRCEYCFLHQDDTALSHHIDHIIPLKHGGQPVSENLALACLQCNRRKGSDLTSIDPIDKAIVPLFNPRSQVWEEHFMLEGAQITGQTAVGRATVALLRLNEHTRIIQRQLLMDASRYPLSSESGS